MIRNIGLKPEKIFSRGSNKENKSQQNHNIIKSKHCQIDMTCNVAYIRQRYAQTGKFSDGIKIGSPSNFYTAKNSVQRLSKDSLNSSCIGRQSLCNILSKSISKQAPMRPRIGIDISTSKQRLKIFNNPTKHKQQHQRKLTIKNVLNQALFEVGKYSCKEISQRIDGYLEESEFEVQSAQRETVGLLRLLIAKLSQKQTQFYQKKLQALEEAQQLSGMYKQELKRKSRQLLWLKQQMSCHSNESIYKYTKEPMIASDLNIQQGEDFGIIRDNQQISVISEAESSICEYIVPPSREISHNRIISDEMRTKLRLNLLRVRELKQMQLHQNRSD